VPAEKLRVLLVEDNPGDARLVQKLLQGIDGLSAQVETATTLADALTFVKESQVEVVLADPGLTCLAPACADIGVEWQDRLTDPGQNTL